MPSGKVMVTEYLGVGSTCYQFSLHLVVETMPAKLLICLSSTPTLFLLVLLSNFCGVDL